MVNMSTYKRHFSYFKIFLKYTKHKNNNNNNMLLGLYKRKTNDTKCTKARGREGVLLKVFLLYVKWYTVTCEKLRMHSVNLHRLLL